MNMKTRALGISVAAMCATTAFVHGHGSMQHPPSRVYIGWSDGVKNSPHAAIQAAIEVGGTQPFYDWNEVVNFFPGDSDVQLNAPYESTIPDGQIASGGNPKYAGLDLVRDDWPAMEVSQGPFEFVWYATTPHNPNVFNAWITTPDWDPSQPLNWAQLEPLVLGPVLQEGNEYRFTTSLPPRIGKHAIFAIWQRIDPAGEGFYSLSDVDFGTCEESCDCTADLSLDGRVDGADMGLLLAAWGSAAGDVNDDGATNGADLGQLLSEWGPCAPDCDGDGVSDYEAIQAGAPDCNHDGVPDSCQAQLDCDGDGVWDDCAIGDGLVEDCNANLIPDSCELAGGGADEDNDGILDDCQLDGFTFEWSVQDDWGSGFNAYLTIHNDSNQCLSGWELLFEANGFEVTEVWNGRLVPREGEQVRIVNETWNGDVCHGESFSVGLQCSGSPSSPQNVYLNDSPVEEAP